MNPDARYVYTVSALSNEVRDLLESSFPMLWVEGEISNLSRPASGHLYFSLKDASSQVRCAMFRNQNRLLRFQPGNGQQVLVRARISLYTPRGDFQLIVESMEESGAGALRRAFEELKQKLASEGLFEAALKRPPPEMPERIGVITSPGGAAVRDALTVLRRRFPLLPVRIYPVPVQGADAAPAIVAALKLADERGDCDVLLLVRGGGSLEDLQAFNDESVARAIHACRIPVVTGIGHEVDYTIADFVADVRAATPSAAAEAVSPDQDTLRLRCSRLGARLARTMHDQMGHRRERLDWLNRRIRHPRQKLLENVQRLDNLSLRLDRTMDRVLHRRENHLQRAVFRLRQRNPMVLITAAGALQKQLARRLVSAWRHTQDARRASLGANVRALDAVSPLATLQRGYSILTSVPEGRLIHSLADTREGKRLHARVRDGRLLCTVEGREQLLE